MRLEDLALRKAASQARSVLGHEGRRHHERVGLDRDRPRQPAHPSLDEHVHADVVVIGGGIVGITTALLLNEAGIDVVLLEANQLARGVSGYTTAKVSSQHGLIYARLRAKFGVEGARTYGQANQAALAWMAARVESDGIDCDFRRQASYAYVTSDGSRAKLEDEVAAAVEAGLPATLISEPPLPFAVAGAVRFGDQAEFHVRKYLLTLAERLTLKPAAGSMRTPAPWRSTPTRTAWSRLQVVA